MPRTKEKPPEVTITSGDRIIETSMDAIEEATRRMEQPVPAEIIAAEQACGQAEARWESLKLDTKIAKDHFDGCVSHLRQLVREQSGPNLFNRATGEVTENGDGGSDHE